ncbi:MAG: glycosyl hydrolase family 28 protein [Bacteroidota bacterium]
MKKFLLIYVFINTLVTLNAQITPTSISQTELTVYSAPDSAPVNTTYSVFVKYDGGEWIDLHEYDAGVDGGFGTEPLGHMSFVYFDSDFSKMINVRVVKNDGTVNDVKIRPESAGIIPSVDGNTVEFSLSNSKKLSVEFDGDLLNNLMVFANDLETDIPDSTNANVHYFGPGIHKIGNDGRGILNVKSDETVYIAGGAIVYGHIEVKSPTYSRRSNVTIRGRGILSGDMETGHVYNHPDHYNTHPLITVYITENAKVEGIILHNTVTFNVHIHFSKNVEVKDLKIMSWTINSDGIDPQCSSDILIDNCFVRNFDDGSAITLNWFEGNNILDPENPSNNVIGNITIQNSIYWSDQGRAILVGPALASTVADQVLENITVKNIDILYTENYSSQNTDWAKGVLAINCGDNATVRNVLYEDIRVDKLGDATNLITLNMVKTPYSESEGRKIENIVFNRVSLNSTTTLNNYIHGFSADRMISGVYFYDLKINGVDILNAAEGGFDINEHTENIQFAESMPETELITYDAPVGAPANDTYTVFVKYDGGSWIDLHEYNAPVDGSAGGLVPGGNMSFVYFDSDFSKRIDIRVEKNEGTVNDVQIRPVIACIQPTLNGNVVEFSITEPQKLSVEFDGDKLNNLMVFADTLETDIPDSNDANVHYFGPGIHMLGGDGKGTLTLKSNETVYIAGGAIVYGTFLLQDPAWQLLTGITIRGRGILSQSMFDGHPVDHAEHWGTVPLISCTTVEDSKVEGIILHNYVSKAIYFNYCNWLDFKDLKILGWSVSANAITPSTSSDITVTDNFMRISGECIAAKLSWFGGGILNRGSRNITVENSALWIDQGRAVVIGPESAATTDQFFEDITVRNVDILYAQNFGGDVHDWSKGTLVINAGDSVTVRNVFFEDIRVEAFGLHSSFVNFTMTQTPLSGSPGTRIENINFKNIDLTTATTFNNAIYGLDSTRMISGVYFENYRINGSKITNANEGMFDINEFAEDIQFERISINLPELTVWAAPDSAPVNTTYSVFVKFDGGQWISLHEYNAPVDGQGTGASPAGNMSFVYFDSDFSKRIDVRVVKNDGTVSGVQIRPINKGIEPIINGNIIEFSITEPQKLSVEMNGDLQNNLMVFANSLETDIPDSNDSNVHYFGPGIHKLGVDGKGTLNVSSNETVYIAGGAIVYGTIEVQDPGYQLLTNVTIRGRGILSGDMFESHDFTHPDHATEKPLINFTVVNDSKIDGIILHNTVQWNVKMVYCNNIDLEDLKIMGWTINGNGVVPQVSNDITIDNCFVRSNDDCFSVKLSWYGGGVLDRGARNILFENSVLWADQGRAFIIGAESASTNDKFIEEITMRSMDILYVENYDGPNLEWAKGVLAINAGDSVTVRNVLYEDIRVDKLGNKSNLITLTTLQTAFNGTPGKRIENITFNRISLNSNTTTDNYIYGVDSSSMISGVYFNDLKINGSVINNAEDGKFDINEYAENIQFVDTYVGEVAKGKPVTASSECNLNGLDATNVNDGNMGTRWAPFCEPYDYEALGTPFLAYFFIDLQDTYSIDSVAIYWHDAYATDFTVQVSNDIAVWDTVFIEGNGDGGVDEITFNPVNVRYIGVMTDSSSNSWDGGLKGWAPSVWEFKVYEEKTTSVETRSPEAIKEYSLSQNYPNPFNPTTKITFNLLEPGNTELSVYNILGQKVITLVNEELNAGSYSYTFDASPLSSGIYFYKIVSKEFSSVKKMMLIK